MAVGGRVLRTLEARWPPCPDRILRRDNDSRFFAALSALSFPGRPAALGSRRNCSRCIGRRSLLGRAAADVHFYSGQLAALAGRTRRRASLALVFHTTSFSPLAESARWFRAWTGAAAGIYCRAAYGNGHRQHTLARGAPYRFAVAVASAGLFGARASEPQRRSSLCVSVPYFILVRDAIVDRRVALTGFP